MEESKIIKITNDSTIQKERFNNLGLKRFKVIKYEQLFDSSIKDKFLNYAKINRYISIIYFKFYKKYFKNAFISLIFFFNVLIIFFIIRKMY